ncbi:MAG: TolC family protein [Bacteroidales bacterium]|nr:TolC family protein [Bacteroidales bacterium]
MRKQILLIALSLAFIPASLTAQTLTLEECRQMAIESNRDLEQARAKVEMAGYDRKIALANYFPKVSATGAYIHNSRDLSLLSKDMSNNLQNAGTTIQGIKDQKMQELMQLIQSKPEIAQQIMSNPDIQQFIAGLQQMDYSAAINQIGSSVNDLFTIDIKNIAAGVISAQQPVFVGGKIIAANRIAKLAEELSRTQYDQKYEEILVEVDQAYWQIVSVANKKELAESYADLLHKMENDVAVAVKEGVATESDALQIKVKANEADMLLTKANNGLTLAKMLLCKEIGLPLDSDITLAGENLSDIPLPEMLEEKNLDDIYADRAETKSLELASQIYEGKVDVARADMMPQIALTANYIVTNPNLYHGFSHKFGGMVSAGVMVNIPIFHGFEAIQKTRKAKTEASLYRLQLDDAKDLINLQVTQLRKQREEAYEHLRMAESNLENAEENMRVATIGFEEGVIEANTALAAQTAWLQAHSEYIDAGIELQMNAVNLRKAEGCYSNGSSLQND